MRQNRNGRGERRRPAGGGDPQGLGDVLTFMRVLWAAEHALRSASKRMRSHTGVTGPQRLVIRMLGRFPDATAGDLAGLLHLHPSTLTGVLDRLDKNGFLVRKVDPDDGRRARFDLSARGRRVDRSQAGTIEAR